MTWVWTTLNPPFQTSTAYWTGGYDNGNSYGSNIDIDGPGLIDNKGKWTWDDDSAFSYVNWESNQPDYSIPAMQCIQIKIETGEWLAVDCGFQAYGICEKHSSEMIFVPPDDCKGPDCCRGHVGAEYGGIIESSAFTSSSDLLMKNSDGKQYIVGAAERGRLNYPTVANETGAGWYADEKDHAPWLQIDFPDYYEIRGIVTQGGDWGNQALLSSKFRNR